MIDERERFEEAFALFERPEPAWERLVHRRERKRRNQRITAAVVGVAVFALAAIGFARLLGSEVTPASDPRSAFLGTWTSSEIDDPSRSQTMIIRSADAATVDIVLQDESSWLCSDRQTRGDGIATPSTLTGTGRFEDATTLVVPSPALACAGLNGRKEPGDSGLPEEQGGTSYTLVLDRATDRLFDNLGVAWQRGATSETRADVATDCESGACAMLGGEITFYAPEGRPWIDHVEAYIDPQWFFLRGPREYGLGGGAYIDIVANPSPDRPCDALPTVPASAETLVRAIRSNPNLETTAPVVEQVGGIDALRFDVAAAPGASMCVSGDVPLFSVPGRPWGDIAHGELGRLYVLDLPGGYARSLVIMITAREATFERAVQAARPVVDSFEFHTG